MALKHSLCTRSGVILFLNRLNSRSILSRLLSTLFKSHCDQNLPSGKAASFHVSCSGKKNVGDLRCTLQTHIKSFHRREKFFHAVSSCLTEILRSRKRSQTWQSDSRSHVWSDITPVLLSVDNPFVLNSFTLILLTVFSTCFQRLTCSSVGGTKLSAPRLLAYFWINVWQRASLSLSKRQGIREDLEWWEGHTQS